jgi:IS5 family transposase
MEQMSLASTGFELVTKRTRKREFLDEMDLVIPWSELLALIAPHAPAGKTGRPPFATEVMLRIHLLQQFFGHSDPAMEEALHDIPLYREFARLDAGITRLPDESTILRFRHLLEAHQLAQQILATVNAGLIERGLMLKTGTVVDATLIAAPSSTKNDQGQRDPEMHQTKKGNQWRIAMMPGQRRVMDKSRASNALKEQLEKIKASIRAKVEHPFRVIKCQFGHRKVRYRGLAKNTSQLLVMFALSNLWMVRKRISRGLQA